MGIDPYPYDLLGHVSRSAARSAAAVQQRWLGVRHGASVWLFFSGLMLKLWKTSEKYWKVSHRIHGAGIYANIGGILMVNVTIYVAYMDPMGMTWGWVQFLCTRFLWTWISSSWLILTVRNGNKPIYNTVNESPNKIIRFWVWVACRRTRATTASLDPVWHHTNTQGKIYELFMLSLLYPIAQFASYWLYLNFDMFALSLSHMCLWVRVISI